MEIKIVNENCNVLPQSFGIKDERMRDIMIKFYNIVQAAGKHWSFENKENSIFAKIIVESVKSCDNLEEVVSLCLGILPFLEFINQGFEVEDILNSMK